MMQGFGVTTVTRLVKFATNLFLCRQCRSTANIEPYDRGNIHGRFLLRRSLKSWRPTIRVHWMVIDPHPLTAPHLGRSRADGGSRLQHPTQVCEIALRRFSVPRQRTQECPGCVKICETELCCGSMI